MTDRKEEFDYDSLVEDLESFGLHNAAVYAINMLRSRVEELAAAEGRGNADEIQCCPHCFTVFETQRKDEDDSEEMEAPATDDVELKKHPISGRWLRRELDQGTGAWKPWIELLREPEPEDYLHSEDRGHER